MELTHRLVTAVVVAATAMATSPAFAQNRHEPHAQNRSGAAAAQSEARPRANADARPRANVAGQPRANDAARPAPVAPSAVAPSVVAPSQQRAVPRAVPRGYDNHAYAARPQTVRPYYAHPYYARPYYAYPRYARPYAFRPHSTLRFGIVLGYPVPYSYYAYPYPVPVYGYGAPAGPIVVGPSSTQYGGVALEINPPDASVYVDGGYAGVVGDFDGREHTLTLAAGRHHIEISAPGFQTMILDPDVAPGQVVPYQGSLQPY
jgi:hypothetical protein